MQTSAVSSPHAEPPGVPERQRASRIGALSHLLAEAAVFVLSCLTYLNAGHERLFFDSLLLTQDPDVTNWDRAVRKFLQSGLWPGQDLSMLSFAANHAWNVRSGRPGFEVRGFLIINVVLHAANSVLVYWFMCELLRWTGASARPASIIAILSSMVFAVHPLNATSVVYIVQRRGLLAVFFCLLGLLAYIRLRLTSAPWPKAMWAIVLVCSCILCAKSRTTGMTVPLVLLALEYCRGAADWNRTRRFLKWGAVVLGLCMAAWSASLVSTGWLDLKRVRIAGTGASQDWGVFEQFFTQMGVLAVYWKLMVLPLPGWLCIDHPFTAPHQIINIASLSCLAMHLALLCLALVAARRGWVLASFGVLLFYIGAAPWVFVSQGEQIVEYKTYLSTVGFILVLGEAFSRISSKLGATAPTAMLIVVAAMLFAVTRQRNTLFKDPVLLWTDVIAKHPNHFRAHVSLGTSYAEAGRYADAMESFRRAERAKPFNAALHFYMGNALRNWGRFEEAIAEYQEGRRIAGGDLHIAVNLAATLVKVGRDDESVDVLRTGISNAWPGTDSSVTAMAHFNLANGLAGKGMLDEAERAYREAIAVNPNYASACYGLALILERQGRPAEAVEQLYAALRIKPDYADAQQALQRMLSSQSGGGR